MATEQNTPQHQPHSGAERPPQQAGDAQKSRSSRPSPTTQKIEGKADEWKGRLQQAGGALTGDSEAKAEGQVQEVKGRFKQTIARWRDKLRSKI